MRRAKRCPTWCTAETRLAVFARPARHASTAADGPNNNAQTLQVARLERKLKPERAKRAKNQKCLVGICRQRINPNYTTLETSGFRVQVTRFGPVISPLSGLHNRMARQHQTLPRYGRRFRTIHGMLEFTRPGESQSIPSLRNSLWIVSISQI